MYSCMAAREDDLLANHMLNGLVVLQADFVNQLDVELDGLVHLHGPWPRVRLRIVDRDLHVERSVRRPPQPFGHGGSARERSTVGVEPETIAKTNGLHDER